MNETYESVLRTVPEGIDARALRIELDAFREEHGRQPFHNELAELFGRTRLRSAPEAVLPSSPGDRAEAHALLDRLRPWVDEIRAAIGDRDPGLMLPFRSLSQAAEWIEANAAIRGKVAHDRERYDRLDQEVRERIAQMSEMDRLEPGHYSAGDRLLLAYQKPGGRMASLVPVDPDSPLAPLAREVPRMAKATGFAENALTMHVLTGRPLALAPAVLATPHRGISLPDGTSLLRREIVLTLRSPELSRDEWLRLYGIVRKRWGSERRKRMTRRDEIVLQTVGSSRDWKQLLPIVNERLRDEDEDVYESPDALRMAHGRAVRKQSRRRA